MREIRGLEKKKTTTEVLILKDKIEIRKLCSDRKTHTNIGMEFEVREEGELESEDK